MTTKAEKEYMGRVSELGCIVCEGPAEIHHLTSLQYRGKGQKASNYDIIGLCHRHHRTGGYGVAVHAGVKEWEKNFGTQTELLEKVKNLLNGAQN